MSQSQLQMSRQLLKPSGEKTTALDAFEIIPSLFFVFFFFMYWGIKPSLLQKSGKPFSGHLNGKTI